VYPARTICNPFACCAYTSGVNEAHVPSPVAHDHEPTRRRRALPLGILAWALLLGLVTSLLIAWGAVLRRDTDSWESNLFSDGEPFGVASDESAQPDMLSTFRLSTLGVTAIRGFFEPAGATNLKDSPVSDVLPPSIAPWRRDLFDDRTQSIGRAWFTLYAAGWPLSCVDGSDFEEAWPEPVRFGLVSIDEGSTRRVMPIRPRPLALIANTIAWSAPWLIVLLLPRKLRSRRRRTRGYCPACGYDLRADYSRPCPECGRADSRPPVATTSAP
jgi:hypothetical protein